jgi:hypothetical protein
VKGDVSREVYYEVDFSTMLLENDVCGDDEFAVTGWNAWRWKTRSVGREQ